MESDHALEASLVDRMRDPAVERIERRAKDTFGTDEKTRHWLHRPTTALSGSSPIETVLADASGERQVIDLLNRIDHGLSA